MAFTKISGAVIADGAIGASQLSDSVPTVGPTITSIAIANSTWHVIDDTAVNTGGGYIIITGENFDSGANVVIGSVEATSVTYVNTTTLKVEVPSLNAASYTVYTINSDGASAIKVSGISVSANPIWVTDATLSTQEVDAAFSISLDATDATSYANTTELPAGTTLLSNGYFYGTITGIETNTNYTFTIRATDAENQDSDKEFTLPVNAVVSGQFQVTSNPYCLTGTFTVPNGVTKMSGVVIGSGSTGCCTSPSISGGAGALSWFSNFPVIPGETITWCMPYAPTALNGAPRNTAYNFSEIIATCWRVGAQNGCVCGGRTMPYVCLCGSNCYIFFAEGECCFDTSTWGHCVAFAGRCGGGTNFGMAYLNGSTSTMPGGGAAGYMGSGGQIGNQPTYDGAGAGNCYAYNCYWGGQGGGTSLCGCVSGTTYSNSTGTGYPGYFGSGSGQFGYGGGSGNSWWIGGDAGIRLVWGGPTRCYPCCECVADV